MKYLGVILKNVIKFVRSPKIAGQFILSIYLMSLSVSSHAKISDWVKNLGSEITEILPVVQLAFGFVGFVIFVLSFMEYKKQQKGQKEYGLAWTGWLVGIALGVAVPVYLESIKSVTDEDNIEFKTEADDWE